MLCGGRPLVALTAVAPYFSMLPASLSRSRDTIRADPRGSNVFKAWNLYRRLCSE